MSLLKRLLLSVTVAILIILVGTLAWSVSGARQYLDGQLQSESENAASALALSLSQPSNQDEITRELLMMALYDSGQFSYLRFTATDGSLLFERAQEASQVQPGQAPAWFVKWLPLHQPEAQRGVSNGWQQVGQLTLAVGNAYAYDALWESSTRMAAWVLAAGLLWAMFVVALLRWFRRVLQQEVAAQVMAIGQQDAGMQITPAAAVSRSRVAELDAVVSAIRDTRERVRATAQEQDARIESLQLELHRDAVTGLPNRKYLVNELRRTLAGELGPDAQHGHVFLFRQRDLHAVNTHLTRANADAWLADVGEKLQAELAKHATTGKGTLMARLNGSDFVVLLPALPGPQALLLVQQLRQCLQSLRAVLADGQHSRWAYAVTDYVSTSSVADVLGRLDQALMRVESAGHADVEFLTCAADGKPGDVLGEGQWQQLLGEALQRQDGLYLQVQDVRSQCRDAVVLRHEAGLLLRGESEADTLAAALFLPVAVRLGLSAEFDQRAIALALQWLDTHADAALMVRVSLPSLLQPSFLPHVQGLLQPAALAVRERLILELDAHGLESYADESVAFGEAMQALGVGVALRRLDQAPLALGLLHAIPLRYVKLGGDFAGQAATSPGLRQLLVAMLETAHQLGVAVHVTNTVDADIAELLRSKHACMPLP